MLTNSQQNVQLEVEQLVCERGGRQLFAELTFSLAAGEVCHIQGENGSGKTSLLRMLCGLLPAKSGQIRWQGQPIIRQREHYRTALSFIGQRAGLRQTLTVMQNLDALLAYRACVSDCSVTTALARVGLQGYGDTLCRALSAGQQRRVLLARLLLEGSALWLLDEPLTALDQAGVLLVTELIQAQVAAGGSVILSSHQKCVGALSGQTITL